MTNEDKGPGWQLTLHGDLYADKNELLMYVNSAQMYSKVEECLSMIRSRLKYNDDLSDKEVAFLEEIRSTLFLGWDD